ncbi:MAG TPA: UDP-N-acetylmuramoyl-L-alanyl-D-glutamate--2,6-diaminopimelate ligase [Firmicutes bacterium]|nr:UDP-N-acetylmuramoyl-L-alanyl-D-glutamate--2,6-diaminopimelate ligase [Bacillota bacterium]
MKLSDILKGISCTADWDVVGDPEITDVSDDSRRIAPGSMYVCIKGARVDGHNLAVEALSKGAAVILCEHDLGIRSQVLTADTRKAYPEVCANFFGHPADRLKLIGVTGTNGKTTITILLKNILRSLGISAGLIGTIQNEIGDKVFPTSYTTPEAYTLQTLFDGMVRAGCPYAVMEVTSQALAQNRLGKLNFAVSVFTNLTQDHLDYHQTMENYFEAKKQLFTMSDAAVINIDDPYGKKLAESVECRVMTVSAQNPSADFYAHDIVCSMEGVSFKMECHGVTCRIRYAVPGMFSVYNALCAVAACTAAGISLEKAVDGINQAKGTCGRSELLPTGGRDFAVICDYSHTPDSLQKILETAREYTKNRLIVLFGCGGDRDRTKRPIMGRIAAQLADFILITSDNPRTEDPMKIIQDILEGVQDGQTPYITIPDRREAISYALRHAQPGDVVILAGKGHEDYQVIGTEKTHFDEHEIVAQIIEEMNQEQAQDRSPASV